MSARIIDDDSGRIMRFTWIHTMTLLGLLKYSPLKVAQIEGVGRISSQLYTIYWVARSSTQIRQNKNHRTSKRSMDHSKHSKYGTGISDQINIV